MPVGIYDHKKVYVFTENRRKQLLDIGFKKGHKDFVSIEARKKQAEKMKGKTWKQKNPNSWNKGLKGFMAGENSPHWIKDRSKLKKENKQGDSAYREWRKSVWLRDVFQCKIVNQDCKGRVEAHHILAWRDYPELRYNVNNGITLCQFHHPHKRVEEQRFIPILQRLVAGQKT